MLRKPGKAPGGVGHKARVQEIMADVNIQVPPDIYWWLQKTSVCECKCPFIGVAREGQYKLNHLNTRYVTTGCVSFVFHLCFSANP